MSAKYVALLLFVTVYIKFFLHLFSCLKAVTIICFQAESVQNFVDAS